MKRATRLVTGIAVLLITGCKNKPAPVLNPAQQAAATSPVSSIASTPADEQMTAAESPRCDDCVTVTPQNFARAETDLYFGNFVKQGGLGKLVPSRGLVSLDAQKVVRMNRDTLYTTGVFDLDAGPVTVILPDVEKRYVAMQVVDEDEYTPMVVYGKGTHTVSKREVGTRYAAVLIRMLVNPQSQQDLDKAHKAQDAIKVSQRRAGNFQVPKWDKASQDKVRDALAALALTMQDFSKAFGTKQQTDPVQHLVGAASGWGGNPERDAKYVNLKVPDNDGVHLYTVRVGKVPVDGFWSISVYNAKGYFEKNAYDAYSVNDITAQKNSDGTVTVQFGGCDGKIPNCLPITSGWNAVMRLYRPRMEILNGRWKFPELQGM